MIRSPIERCAYLHSALNSYLSNEIRSGKHTLKKPFNTTSLTQSYCFFDSLFPILYLNICSIRYPPCDDKTFCWIRWLMGSKEQSYKKLSDYPPPLVSIPVSVAVRQVSLLHLCAASSGFSVICGKQRSPLPNLVWEILQPAEIKIFQLLPMMDGERGWNT